MKTLVYINIDFYSYNKEIISSLNRLGYQVLFYNYKPCHSSFSKFLFKFDPLYRKRAIHKLVKRIVQETQDKDISSYLMINPTTLSADDVKAIFKGHEEAQKILYLWDSTRTYPCVLEIAPLFDKCYSFDPLDCQKKGYPYRATFACAEDLIPKPQEDYRYDLFYIASYDKQRYKVLIQAIDYCEKNNLSFYYHLYVKNKLAYLFYKLTNPKLKKKYVRFYALSNEEKSRIQSQSRCILDTPLATQSGLTMRVIEGLVLGKKIITSNPQITSFDFYNPDDFYLFSKDKFSLDKTKLALPIHFQIDSSYYSADSFVKELLGGIGK